MAKAKTLPDDLISTSQAAAELGITATRVLILIKEGRIPAVRIGSYWAMRRADLDGVRNRPNGRPRKNGQTKSKAKRPASS